MAHFRAQQRHAAGHAATLPAAEHGDLETDFAVAGSNGAGVAMMAVHGQAAMVAKGLVVVQILLEGGQGYRIWDFAVFGMIAANAAWREAK